MADLMTADRQTCASHLADGLTSDEHVAECGPCHRVATRWNPPTAQVNVAHEGFTSTGGYHYRATEITRHAGPIARLAVYDFDSGVREARPVSLEPEEAAEIGVWLLRNAISHEHDPDARALLTSRLDTLSRELASVLADQQ